MAMPMQRLECDVCLRESVYELAYDWVVNSRGKWVCDVCDGRWRETMEQDREALGRAGHRRTADEDYHGTMHEE